MGKLSSRLPLPIGMLDLSDKRQTAYTGTGAQPGATPSSNFQLARLGMEHSRSSCTCGLAVNVSWTLFAIQRMKRVAGNLELHRHIRSRFNRGRATSFKPLAK